MNRPDAFLIDWKVLPATTNKPRRLKVATPEGNIILPAGEQHANETLREIFGPQIAEINLCGHTVTAFKREPVKINLTKEVRRDPREPFIHHAEG